VINAQSPDRGGSQKPMLDRSLRISPSSGDLLSVNRSAQRLIDLTAHPEAVHQHGQLASHCHDSPFFRVLPTAGHQGLAPAPEIRIGAKVSQYVLRAPHQKPPQEVIARFGNGQLRPTLPGIVAPRPQAEVTADIAAPLKSMRIVDGQYKRQAGQCTYSVDLLDQLSPRIPCAGQLLDLFVIGADPAARIFNFYSRA
jgi:hypothetical protein